MGPFLQSLERGNQNQPHLPAPHTEKTWLPHFGVTSTTHRCYKHHPPELQAPPTGVTSTTHRCYKHHPPVASAR
eukprot:364246-Chlamydomonas_euryale.AAC.12